MTSTLIIGILGLSTLAAMLLFVLTRTSTPGGSDHTGCLACGSADLEMLAASAYRCQMCGHEGGDGYPAYAWTQTVAHLDALDETARQQHLDTQRDLAAGHLSVARAAVREARRAEQRRDSVPVRQKPTHQAHVDDHTYQALSALTQALPLVRQLDHCASRTPRVPAWQQTLEGLETPAQLIGQIERILTALGDRL